MIKYIKGDATEPIQKPAMICHMCNDIGKWGKGFVLALSNKWPVTREKYIAWHKGLITNYSLDLPLGELQSVKVEDDIWVYNMIAQEGIYTKDGKPPIRYEALAKCLITIHVIACMKKRSIHMPRIGCGLAGGEWDKVKNLINLTLSEHDVYVYDLPKG